MQAMRIVGPLALMLLFTDLVIAQEDLLDEPRQLEQLTFSPPTSASIRLRNGVRRTGKIVSISRESMVYQVGRDNKEVSVEIDDIQRVNTLDNEFTYQPADEDFERLRVKANRISFITVQTVETYVPPPEGVTPDDPPAVVVDPVPTPATTPIPETQPEMRPETVPAGDGGTSPAETTGTTGTTDPAVQPTVQDIPEGDPAPGSLVLFCGSCNGMLPLSVKNGDECPHCGRIFWNATATSSGSVGSTAQGAAGGGYPDAAAAAYPTAAGGAPNGDANAATAPASGGGNVMARGTGLADIPMWMKVGFFAGLLAVAWLLLQRR